MLSEMNETHSPEVSEDCLEEHPPIPDGYYVGTKSKRIEPNHVFNPNDARIKEDILSMIGMYLQHEGYSATAFTLQDEASIKLQERTHKHSQVKRVRQTVLEGDWEAARRLATKLLVRRNHRSVLYQLYRQEYLELIDRQETQRAFIYLLKRLKPHESTSKVHGSSEEFRDLCYLLTCRSVQDVKSFANWGGVTLSRERLADHLEMMLNLEVDSMSNANKVSPSQPVAPKETRLVDLLQQAVAYQIEFSPYHPKLEPKVGTILDDFHCRVVPNAIHRCFTGHTNNVKCIDFLGVAGDLLASGSSDHTICLWPLANEDQSKASTDQQEIKNQDVSEGSQGFSEGLPPSQTEASMVLFGHTSRVWDLSSDPSGRFLASGSGDGTVRLWKLRMSSGSSSDGTGVQRTVSSNSSMVMNLANSDLSNSRSNAKPGWNSDLSVGQVSRASGTIGANARGMFVAGKVNTKGNLVRTVSDPHNISSATEGTLTDADVECLMLHAGHNGDVYSVQYNAIRHEIASAGYDKTVRLLDVETDALLKTFYGHTAGVTHAVFNPTGNLLVTGSKDSTIKFWDVLSGVCVRTISGLLGEVTSLSVASDGLRLLSGSKDSSNRLWDLRTCKALVRFKGHQNTSRNFIRASFGPRDELVFGGSEDGRLHVWDSLSGKLLERLEGHIGPVYRSIWNDKRCVVASCSDDATVRTWYQK